MKTSGELISLLGSHGSLDHTRLSNFRRQGYLHPIKERGEYRYSERDRLILQRALPELDEKKLSVAFAKAEGHFESVVQEIFSAIADYQDKNQGLLPTDKDLQRVISATPLSPYIEALVEQNRLRTFRGALQPVAVYKPKGLLAYEHARAHAGGWTLLPADRRMAIREISLELFLSETRDLDKKIPVPVGSLLQRQGFTIEYLNLAPGRYGYNDPDDKTIYISDKIRNNRDRRRLVAMHEYFHVLLKHGLRECSEDDADHREAEATYGSVHYLMPLHTYDFIARQSAERTSTFTQLLRRIARTYQVPLEVAEQYQHEIAASQGIDPSFSLRPRTGEKEYLHEHDS